jgi:hypothetical protein
MLLSEMKEHDRHRNDFLDVFLQILDESPECFITIFNKYYHCLNPTTPGLYEHNVFDDLIDSDQDPGDDSVTLHLPLARQPRTNAPLYTPSYTPDSDDEYDDLDDDTDNDHEESGDENDDEENGEDEEAEEAHQLHGEPSGTGTTETVDPPPPELLTIALRRSRTAAFQVLIRGCLERLITLHEYLREKLGNGAHMAQLDLMAEGEAIYLQMCNRSSSEDAPGPVIDRFFNIESNAIGKQECESVARGESLGPEQQFVLNSMLDQVDTFRQTRERDTVQLGEDAAADRRKHHT